MTETRWLTAEQQETWRTFLKGTARLHQYLDADLRKYGLDLAEYEILVHLSEADGRRMRMSELASRVEQSRSRLTHTVSRMEKRVLVERTSCANDGRGVWAGLTDKGLQLLEEMAPIHVRAVRRILVDVVDPADFRALGRAMKAVLSVAD